MKVQINYTIEVDDVFRRGLRLIDKAEGLASRDEVKAWLKENGTDLDPVRELGSSAAGFCPYCSKPKVEVKVISLEGEEWVCRPCAKRMLHERMDKTKNLDLTAVDEVDDV